MNTDKKFLIRGSIINGLGNISKAASPMLVILLARYFSKETFAYFLSLQLFVLTLSRLTVLGLDKGLLWYVSKYVSETSNVAQAVFASLRLTRVLALGMATLTVIFVLLDGTALFPALSQIPKGFFIICLLVLFFYMDLHIGAASMEGLRKPEYKIVINQFIVVVLAPLIALSIHFFWKSGIVLAWSYLGAHIIGWGIYQWVLPKHFGRSGPISIKVPKALLSYSLPLTFVELISGLLLRMDLWMVLALIGPKPAAVYGILVTLANSLKTIRQSFDPLIVPIVSGMDKQKVSESLRSVYSYATNMVTGIQLLIAPAVLIFSKEILLIAGKGYVEGGRALAILLAGNLMNGLLGLSGQVVLGKGKSQAILWLNVVTLGINVLLNFVLIPIWGISGAATATVLSYFFQNSCTFLIQYRLTGIWAYERHLLINAGFIMVCFVWALGFPDLVRDIAFQQRLFIFAAIAFMLLASFFLKRKSFKL